MKPSFRRSDTSREGIACGTLPGMEFGTKNDSRKSRQPNFQWTQDQTSHAPSVLLQVLPSTSSADLPHHLLPAVSEAAVTSSCEHHQQQPQQHVQLRQSLLEDMDAWADTSWPLPQTGSIRTTQVQRSRVEPIDHYLGKPRRLAPSRLRTSLTTCVATAKTVCLVFVVLAMVALCVSIFSIIGDLPAATHRSTEVGAEVLRLPTVVLTDEVGLSVAPELFPPVEEESTSGAQTDASDVTVRRGYSRLDAQPKFLGGHAVCRRCDARVPVEAVDLEKRRHDVTTPGYAKSAAQDEVTQSAERN